MLSFPWQLEEVPGKVLELETWAHRQLVRGPGNWIRPKDLKPMKHQFGLPFDFPSFHDLALSAKMRVMEYEPQINWSSYFDQLAHAMATARMTHAACGNWYGVSYAFIMSSARRRMAYLGITSVSIRSQLMFLHGGRSGTHSLNTYVKNSFQSQVLEQLVKSVSHNHEYV